MTHCSATGKLMDLQSPEGYYYYFSPQHSTTAYKMLPEAYRNFLSVSQTSKHFARLPTMAARHRFVWVFSGNPNIGSLDEKYMRIEDAKHRSQLELEKLEEALHSS